jgi:hypothetical protein
MNSSGSYVLQQQVTNSIQVGNMLPSSRVFGQLLFAFLNEYFARPWGTNSGGSSFEVASVGEDVATGNNTPSKAVVALECQVYEIERTLLCLQAPSITSKAMPSQMLASRKKNGSTQFKTSTKTLASTYPTSNHKGLTWSGLHHGCMH